MARPTKAGPRTAYDLGYEHGRDDTPGGPPEWVNTDELLDAYDNGFNDGMDSIDGDAPAAPPATPKRHRASPTSSAQQPPRGKTGGGASSRRAAPRRSSKRFSNPQHWGSGARGHVVGSPTLRPANIGDATGFAFGLVLYALALSYIRYGPLGPKSWLSAKFINKPLITPDEAAQLSGSSFAARRSGRARVSRGVAT